MSKLSALIDQWWNQGAAAVQNWLNTARGVGVRGPKGGFVRSFVREDGCAVVVLTNRETKAALLQIEMKPSGQGSVELIDPRNEVVAAINVLPTGFAVIRLRTSDGVPFAINSDDLYNLFGKGGD